MTASVRAGNRWVERRTIIELAALTELDLEALAVGEPTGFGTRTDEPVVLVCTHGRRDVCCARLGRPLAVVLDAQMPGRVWETTHVGGDRFAPNVVALPEGSYHGDLSLADVPALVAALQRSEALLPRLRGFAGIAEPAQAADHFLRRHVGETNVDGVRVVAVAESPAGDTCVELLTGAARWCVHVRLQPGTQERLTSCAGSGTRDTPGAYVLTGLRRLG